MQKRDDFFSKVLSAKTAVLTTMVVFLVFFAIISSIIIFTSGATIITSIAKIIAPLGTIGVATILFVDAFHKMTSEEQIVKVFAFATLIFAALDVIFLSLLSWEIIPAYERAQVNFSVYGLSSIGAYTTTVPTIWYKLIMSIVSLTGFTFLSSIVLNAKNNHNLIRISKYIVTGFFGVASFISIISNFIGTSQDALTSTRMMFLQVVSWTTAVCLGIAVYYLSKTITWEEKEKYEEISLEPTIPAAPAVAPAPVVAAAPVAAPAPAESAPTPAPTPAPAPNPMDQVQALDPPTIGHTINPIEDKKE